MRLIMSLKQGYTPQCIRSQLFKLSTRPRPSEFRGGHPALLYFSDANAGYPCCSPRYLVQPPNNTGGRGTHCWSYPDQVVTCWTVLALDSTSTHGRLFGFTLAIVVGKGGDYVLLRASLCSYAAALVSPPKYFKGTGQRFQPFSYPCGGM